MNSQSSSGTTQTCPTPSSSCCLTLTWPTLCATTSLTIMSNKLIVFQNVFFHELAKAGFTDYFSQYALCDAPAQLRVGAGRAAANNVIGDWELLTIQ